MDGSMSGAWRGRTCGAKVSVSAFEGEREGESQEVERAKLLKQYVSQERRRLVSSLSLSLNLTRFPSLDSIAAWCLPMSCRPCPRPLPVPAQVLPLSLCFSFSLSLSLSVSLSVSLSLSLSFSLSLSLSLHIVLLPVRIPFSLPCPCPHPLSKHATSPPPHFFVPPIDYSRQRVTATLSMCSGGRRCCSPPLRDDPSFPADSTLSPRPPSLSLQASCLWGIPLTPQGCKPRTSNAMYAVETLPNPSPRGHTHSAAARGVQRERAREKCASAGKH